MRLIKINFVANYFLILCCFTAFLGCAGSGDSSGDGIKKFSRRKLSESEKLIYSSPTIYYIPDFSQNSLLDCGPAIQINLKRSKDNIQKLNLCKRIYDKCLLQGTCAIQFEGNKTLINYQKKTNGIVQFQIVNTSICPFGLGDSSDGQKSYSVMCIDPFRSVAADLSIYPLGTVIYIDELVGISLPNGTIHDGYFVVRDSGGNIDGRGRFDFFTGFLPTGKQNIFSQIGLGGEANFKYHVVVGPEAERILNQSGFPRLKGN